MLPYQNVLCNDECILDIIVQKCVNYLLTWGVSHIIASYLRHFYPKIASHASKSEVSSSRRGINYNERVLWKVR